MAPHDEEEDDPSDASFICEDDDGNSAGICGLGEACLHLWHSQSIKLQHNYAIIEWVMSIVPVVRLPVNQKTITAEQ